MHDLLQAPCNSGRDNAAGIIIVWWTSPPLILDSLTAPRFHVDSFSRSSTAPWNNYRHFPWFWDQLYGPQRLGLSTEVRVWSQFHIWLNWEYPIFSTARVIFEYAAFKGSLFLERQPIWASFSGKRWRDFPSSNFEKKNFFHAPVTGCLKNENVPSSKLTCSSCHGTVCHGSFPVFFVSQDFTTCPKNVHKSNMCLSQSWVLSSSGFEIHRFEFDSTLHCGTSARIFKKWLVVRENWLAREYMPMPAHQHCGLFYPLWSKETPPPGGISYLPCSLLKNRVKEEPPRRMCTRFLEGGPLTHGSWWGNIVNRKPPPGGGGSFDQFVWGPA